MLSGCLTDEYILLFSFMVYCDIFQVIVMLSGYLADFVLHTYFCAVLVVVLILSLNHTCTILCLLFFFFFLHGCSRYNCGIARSRYTNSTSESLHHHSKSIISQFWTRIRGSFFYIPHCRSGCSRRTNEITNPYIIYLLVGCTMTTRESWQLRANLADQT